MKIIDLTIDDAKEIISWKYDGEYAIYNYPSFEECQKLNYAITYPEKLKLEFKKIIDNENNFIGYARYRFLLDTCLIGVGMNPIYCGKHHGKEFIETIIEPVKDKTLLLEVRSFNKRAIKCYESVGFKIYETRFCEEDQVRPEEFTFMRKDAN